MFIGVQVSSDEQDGRVSTCIYKHRMNGVKGCERVKTRLKDKGCHEVKQVDDHRAGARRPYHK